MLKRVMQKTSEPKSPLQAIPVLIVQVLNNYTALLVSRECFSFERNTVLGHEGLIRRSSWLENQHSSSLILSLSKTLTFASRTGANKQKKSKEIFAHCKFLTFNSTFILNTFSIAFLICTISILLFH